MRGKSHLRLGDYLIEHYMEDAPERCKKAFLLGCIEPDRNPVTYLKGSLRYQWLRGHNYLNARRYMRRISRRLEHKDSLSLLDYYTLGKLIHYTTDAFTYAHNAMSPRDLGDHREYEAALQEHFLRYMDGDPEIDPQTARSIMDAISRFHAEYQVLPRDVRTDTKYALRACCCVLAVLFVRPIL